MLSILILFLSLPEPAPQTRLRPLLLRNRDSVIVTATELRAGRSRIQIPSETIYFFFLNRKRPECLWGPPSLLLIGHWDSFKGIKGSGNYVDHAPPFGLEVKNE